MSLRSKYDVFLGKLRELDGVLTVDMNHVFADAAARDAYFDTPDPNLDELVQGETFITVGGNFQLWNGETNPSTYSNTNWIAVNSIVQGPKGDKGDQGDAGTVDLTGIPNNRFLYNNNGTIAGASAEELSTEVNFLKSIRTLAESVALGLNVLVSDLGGTIGITNRITNQEFLPIGYQVSRTTGSLDIFKRQYGNAITVLFNGGTSESRTTTAQDTTITFQYPYVRNGRGLNYTFNGNSSGVDVLLSMYIGTDNTGHAVVIDENIGPLNGETTVTGLQLIQFSTVVANYHLVLRRSDNGTLVINGDTIDVNPNNVEGVETSTNNFEIRPLTNKPEAENNQWVPFLRAMGQDNTFVKVLEIASPEIQNDITNLTVNSNIMTATRRSGTTFNLTLPGGNYAAPEITSLRIQGQSNHVQAGTTLSGTVTFLYTLTNRTNISGNLTLRQGSTVLSSAVNPANSSLSIGITSVTLTNVDDTAVFTLSGTDTNSGTFTRTLTITAQAPEEFFYYGLSASNNPASIDTSTMSEEIAASGSFDFSVGPTTAGQYIILLAPTDNNLTSLVNTNINVNVLPNYTATTNVRTINSQQYNSFVFGPVNAGFTQSYRATLN